MRKAVLFTAVVVVAAVGALLWYVGAKAAEPDHITVDVGGTTIDWTIPKDPDCNASLFTDRYPEAVDETMDIEINFNKEGSNGLIVDGDDVSGDVTRGDGYSNRHPTYIYVDVLSAVSLITEGTIYPRDPDNDAAIVLCSNFRWWQINVEVPANDNKTHSANLNAHKAPPDTPEAPTLTALIGNSIQAVGVAPDDGGRAIVSYDWQYRVVGASTWIDQSDQTSLTQTFSSLTASTNYEFQFRATNTKGDSAYSSPTATVMTLAPPASTEPLSDCDGSYYHDHPMISTTLQVEIEVNVTEVVDGIEVNVTEVVDFEGITESIERNRIRQNRRSNHRRAEGLWQYELHE